MKANPRVLLVDDDIKLQAVLAEYLGEHGFDVERAANGPSALGLLERQVFDVVLLDVMMPGEDGLSVLGKLRRRLNVPVIMLTAKGDETDRVVGLELGADDYVAKPFSPRELLARVRAVMRRARGATETELLCEGSLVVDLGARTAVDAGRDLELTGLELDVLVALVRRAGRVVPRERLLVEAGRGDAAVGERTVDVHVSHLRQKLDDPKSAPRIKTVRGVGYVFTKAGS